MQVSSEGVSATAPPLRRLLNTAAAASYIGISKSSLDKWRVSGEGPAFVRIGPKLVFYEIEELNRFRNTGRRRSTSDPGGKVA